MIFTVEAVAIYIGLHAQCSLVFTAVLLDIDIYFMTYLDFLYFTIMSGVR